MSDRDWLGHCPFDHGSGHCQFHHPPEGLEEGRGYPSYAELLEALPDPDKLETLAKWFDVYYTGESTGTEVQDDLRRWAQRIRVVIAKAKGEVEG